MHRYIVGLTVGLLVIAFVTAVVWLITAPSFEPALTCLTLLTAVTGLFIDRWVTEQERRQQLLHALAHELYMNLGALKDVMAIKPQEGEQRPQMLPRFYTSTLVTVISSGAFATTRDKTLWKMLHDWLQRSTEANIRLQTTENLTFMHPSTTTSFYEKLSSGAVMTLTAKTLTDVTAYLMDHYSAESGIDRSTVLFDIPRGPAGECGTGE